MKSAPFFRSQSLAESPESEDARAPAVAGRFLVLTTLLAVAIDGIPAGAQSPDANPSSTASATVDEDDRRRLTPLPDVLQQRLKKATPLNPEKTILLGAERDRVFLHTHVACTDCLLEMFCCLEQTKEHESVLALRGKAYVVHAGLLATGTKPGQPASFDPKFEPPKGPQIDLIVHWVDETGKVKQAKAQDWMRHSVSRYYGKPLASPPPGVKLPLMELRYDPYNKEIIWFGQMSEKQRDHLLKLWDNADYQAAIKSFFKDSQPRPMKAEFVFAGSYEFVPEGTSKKVYAAEGGQLICVANFASATIDVREESSASDGGQSFEANPELVPPRGTPVLLELVPQKSNADSQKRPATETTTTPEQ